MNTETSTLESSDISGNVSNDLIEQMNTISLKRKTTIRWGNDIIDTEDITNQFDIYHIRKKTPKKTNNTTQDNNRQKEKKIIFKVIHPYNEH